jgi:hypothetical protein
MVVISLLQILDGLQICRFLTLVVSVLAYFDFVRFTLCNSFWWIILALFALSILLPDTP